MWPESHSLFTVALETQALKQAQVVHLVPPASAHGVRAGPQERSRAL